MTEAKWKRFERLVYEIQRALAPRAQVTLDDHITGADSHTPRQIDISVRERIGQYDVLVVMECKDHAAPLDVQDVEGFVSKARDVRANKAAIVSASGYTEAAKRLARTHAIDVFRLVDAESTEWASYVTVPALLCRTFLKSFSLTFQDFEELPPIAAAPREMPLLFDGKGRPVGGLRDLLIRKWRELDLQDKPGQHEHIALGRVVIPYGGRTYPTDLYVNLIVAREYYFGPWPVEEMKGLMDAQSGVIHTTRLKTSHLAPYDVETGQAPGWRKLDSAEQLAVKPLVTLYYSDAYETEEGVAAEEDEDSSS